MISLLKLEGTLDNATCYVTLNNQLANIITDFNSRPGIEIKDSGILTIIVKSEKQEIIGSVSLRTLLLPVDIPQ